MKDKRVQEILGTDNKRWERAVSDSDKDGVSNLLDCEPYNKNKQGIIHNIAARYGKGRVKEWGEEGQADTESKKEARSESRQAAREERAKQMKETAVYKEKVKAEKQRKYIKQGGFFGQVGRLAAPIKQQVNIVTKPSKKKRKGKKKKRKGDKTKPKVNSSPPKMDIMGKSWI